MADEVQVQVQNDELTTIFGNLGADIPIPPETPQETGDLDDDGVEASPETPEESGESAEKADEVAEKPEGAVETQTPVKEQPHIPPAVAKQLRQSRREANERAVAAEIRAAKAEARSQLLEELHQRGAFSGNKQDVVEKKAEKSPLEKFADEFPDESPPTRVLIEQETWKAQQQQAQVKQQEVESRTLTLTQQVVQGIEQAKKQYGQLGEGLGLDDVVGLAKAYKLISQEDLEALTPLGVRAGTMAYNLAVEAIRTSSTAASAELARRVAVARSRQASQANVNGKQPKTNKTTNSTNTVDNKTPSNENSPITQFIFGR